ncbi:MAG: methyltransferase domain-containing protein [Gammaproteobacteria bacterium]|nr:methyltransferase domain-containing protein [Gammaproteobacteria bacterium]
MMKMRSKEKELIDLGSSYYTHEEYILCLKILFKINKLMGIFNSTVKLLKRFPDDISLIDVGCGGGLCLLNLSKYYPKMRLLGIDVSEVAIDIAQNELARWKETNPNIHVKFQLQHQLALELSKDSVDVVLTTLVCHHIDDDDLVGFLQNAYQAAREAVIIHDLQRHPIAYWLYKQISPILFRNRLITHDGLVSIQRSFTRAELKCLLKRANISHYQIKWGFPFRWSVILWKKS